MRLWPYQILGALPNKHLCAQWRECCALTSMANKDGTVKLGNINHSTVNRLKDYPPAHLAVYTSMVYDEMKKRCFRARVADDWVIDEVEHCNVTEKGCCTMVNGVALFGDFHDDIYLRQCMFMFQEKFMNGSISYDEWNTLVNRVKTIGNVSMWQTDGWLEFLQCERRVRRKMQI